MCFFVVFLGGRGIFGFCLGEGFVIWFEFVFWRGCIILGTTYTVTILVQSEALGVVDLFYPNHASDIDIAVNKIVLN